MIFAQDEGRFGRISNTKRAWAPPGCRPMAPRQIIRKYIYAYVAVCPALGKMTALILPWANTTMMSIFLNQLSQDYSDYFIIMVTDGAGWHTSKKLQVPENITLVKQPSHSPEVNPVEHIWEEIREKNFHNKALHSLDDVEARLCDGLNQLAQNPHSLSTLTNFPYLSNLTQ